MGIKHQWISYNATSIESSRRSYQDTTDGWVNKVDLMRRFWASKFRKCLLLTQWFADHSIFLVYLFTLTVVFPVWCKLLKCFEEISIVYVIYDVYVLYLKSFMIFSFLITWCNLDWVAVKSFDCCVFVNHKSQVILIIF